MGAYKQTMIEQMEGRSKEEVKISELEQKLYTLETLIERYGFCHPDMQVARLTRDEVFKKYLEEMREKMSRKNDPEQPGARELNPPGTV